MSMFISAAAKRDTWAKSAISNQQLRKVSIRDKSAVLFITTVSISGGAAKMDRSVNMDISADLDIPVMNNVMSISTAAKTDIAATNK
jgi:hypothetical protein